MRPGHGRPVRRLWSKLLRSIQTGVADGFRLGASPAILQALSPAQSRQPVRRALRVGLEAADRRIGGIGADQGALPRPARNLPTCSRSISATLRLAYTSRE